MSVTRILILCVVALLSAACATKPAETTQVAGEIDLDAMLKQAASGGKPTVIDSSDPDKQRKMDEAFREGRPVIIGLNPITEIKSLGVKTGVMIRKAGDPIRVVIGMSERDRIGLADALFQKVIDNLLKEYRWGNLTTSSSLPVSCSLEVSGLGGQEMSATAIEVRCGLRAAVERGNGVFVIRTIHSMMTSNFDTRVDQVSSVIDEAYQEAIKLLTPQ